MTHPRFHDPDPHEQFYARALAVLTRPARRTSLLLHAVNMAYWLAVLAALSWLGSQLLYRPMPVVGRSQILVRSAVAAGEPVKVAYSLRRLQACATDVSWQEVDGNREVHRFGPVHVAWPGKAGEPDSFTYSWATARNASPGPSRLRVVLEYQCPGNYLEAFWPLVEVLPEIDYDTLPAIGGPIERAAPSP